MQEIAQSYLGSTFVILFANSIKSRISKEIVSTFSKSLPK
ncbi:hypothetical protein HMPREF9072_00903 [Capnocytophaga sp. oral taxon 324 str. F0483]|nr:hypothetical protein HMPREF9072_00903 [Capnocytophaga sp. oral taxon 324 str. F0483]